MLEGEKVLGTTGDGADAPAIDDPSPRVPAFDRIVALAADLFEAPAACLALRDGEAVLVEASIGLAGPSRAAWAFPWSEATPLSVGEAGADPRFPGAAAGVGAFRFYAGVPVRAVDGSFEGALCVLDSAPHAAPSPRDIARLERLAALAADALAARIVRERAEARADLKAGLLADVSHELRTPLNGIVGFTQALKRDRALGAAALLAVERIDQASQGLLSIVDDALNLSRLEAGVVRLDPRPFAAARLAEDAAALVRPEAERKGLTLAVDLPRDDAPLFGDVDRIRQVLLNLLSNAVKFTDSGSVRLSLERRASDPVLLRFTVEDSGIGIARADLPLLFRRFARAETGSRRGGGTGLGLAISRALVEAMGGEITVLSAPGEGTRFAVSLGLPRAPVTPAAPAAAAGGWTGNFDGLDGLAILLAEDAALNQKLALQMLEPFGAAVDVVVDGAAAVEAAARRDYALVLMDMEMPVMGGVEATRRIRAMGGRAGAVPIVALTANVFPEQIALCREAGMDDHLTKPFALEALAAAALRWARR